MTAWAFLRAEANALEAHIKQEVLALGGTITVGRARATFNNGRKSYDYEAIAGELGASGFLIGKHSKTVTDWRKLCEDVVLTWHTSENYSRFKEQHYKQARPSVSVKLLNK